MRLAWYGQLNSGLFSYCSIVDFTDQGKRIALFLRSAIYILCMKYMCFRWNIIGRWNECLDWAKHGTIFTSGSWCLYMTSAPIIWLFHCRLFLCHLLNDWIANLSWYLSHSSHTQDSFLCRPLFYKDKYSITRESSKSFSLKVDNTSPASLNNNDYCMQ